MRSNERTTTIGEENIKEKSVESEPKIYETNHERSMINDLQSIKVIVQI